MTPAAKRLWSVGGICLIVTLLSSVLEVVHIERHREWEFYTEDVRLQVGRRASLDRRLIFVAIDQPNYASFYGEDERAKDPALGLISGPWPWSREVWSILIQRLLEGGAKVVGLDILFANPGPGDDVLKKTLEHYRDRVVIGVDIATPEADRGASATLILPTETLIEPSETHPLLDPRLGLIKQTPDQPGGVVRRTRFWGDENLDLLLPADVKPKSFANAMLHQAGLEEFVPRTESPVRLRYAMDPEGSVDVIPIHQILHSPTWEQNYVKKGLFKDAIVVVGPMARIFQDRHRTPFAQDMLGPLIHVNILAAALDRAFLTEAPPLTNFFLSLWAGMVAWLLAWRFSNLLYRFFVAGLSAILYLVLSQLLYDHADTFVAVTSPMLSLMGSTAISMVNDFAQARRDKAQLRRTLERYVSKDVVRELLDNPQTYLHSLTGVRRRVTILFSDVRGFTTMTEAADASLLVKQLNEYFQQMVDIVVKNRGRLDKFIGDAVMADWGSFVTTGHEADAERAVLSAIQMREALKHLNSMWSERGAPSLAFGIGINHGEVIVGNLGSEEKMEVSIIGDAVNLASRLESLTKEYGVDLLLGETVAQLVKDRIPLRTVDWVTVKGKTKPVEVFTITPGCTDIRSIPEWLSLHEQSVRQYRQQEFGPALAGFEQLLARDPNDGLAEVYINRCRSLIANPPGPGWTGVFEAKKK